MEKKLLPLCLCCVQNDQFEAMSISENPEPLRLCSQLTLSYPAVGKGRYASVYRATAPGYPNLAVKVCLVMSFSPPNRYTMISLPAPPPSLPLPLPLPTPSEGDGVQQDSLTWGGEGGRPPHKGGADPALPGSPQHPADPGLKGVPHALDCHSIL